MNPRPTKALPLHPTKRHPLTGQPLRAIAWHPKTLAPVWPIMGGAPKPEDSWATVFAGKTPEQVKKELDDATAANAEWTTTFKDKKPADVKAETRKWEKRARRDHPLAEQARAAGIQPKSAESDDTGKPKGKGKATDESATQAATAAANLARENAVLRLAGDMGGNPRALVDSRRFMDKLAKLDPSADDFESKVEKRIEKALAGTGGERFAADAGGSTGRPKRDPRQGRRSTGRTGTTESGRTAYAERKKARQSGRVA